MKKIFLYLTIFLGLALITSSCDNSTNDESMNGDDEMEGAVVEDTKADVPRVPAFNEVSKEVRDGVEAVLAEYIRLKNDLVKGQSQEAREHATKLQAGLESLRIMDLPADQKQALESYDNKITEHTARLVGLEDIEAQRKQFSGIGDDIYSLVQSFGIKSQTLYYQYCPMAFDNKGAYWVSESDEIRNPYFGDRMMKCGSTRDKLN